MENGGQCQATRLSGRSRGDACPICLVAFKANNNMWSVLLPAFDAADG